MAVTARDEDNLTHLRRQVEIFTGQAWLSGNAVDVLHNGDEIFPAMLKAVESARQYIEFLTFVYWQGEIAVQFATALAEASRRGVTVRVLLDAFGARSMPDEVLETLESSQCNVVWFRELQPLKPWRNDNRTHRKILVCDGDVGFTGGVGIAQEWTGDARDADEWRDTHFCVRGPAVRALRAAFLDNWMEECRTDYEPPGMDDARPGPAGDVDLMVVLSKGNDEYARIGTIFNCLYANARETIAITSPYLSFDDDSTDLLLDAIARGVRVEIVTSWEHLDSALSRYAGARQEAKLLRAGATLYRYNRTLIHTKGILIDGVMACVGSGNVNRRSQRKDEEVALLVADSEITRRLESDFRDDRDRADQLTLAQWQSRGLFTRIMEKVIYPIRNQL